MFQLGKKIEAFAAKAPVAVLVRTVLQRDLNPGCVGLESTDFTRKTLFHEGQFDDFVVVSNQSCAQSGITFPPSCVRGSECVALTGYTVYVS